MAFFGGGGSFGGSGSSGAMPFGRIPPELHESVARVEAEEPVRGRPEVHFDATAHEPGTMTLRSLLARQGRWLGLTGIIVALETVCLQAGPLLTQVAIDHGIVGRSMAMLGLAAGLYVLSLVVGAAASRLRVRWTGRLAASAMTDMRVRVFSHLQRLSLSYYTREPAGVTMTRMTADIEAVQQLLQEGLAQFVLQALTMAAIGTVLFVYDVELALITLLLVVPPLSVLSWWFRSASNVGYRRVRDAVAAVIADLAESLQGVRVVQAHNRARRNTIHHRNITGDYREANDHTARIAGVYGGATGAVGLVGQGALLLIGGRMVMRGELTVGELTAFILYLGALFQPIQQLVQLYNLYQQGQAAVAKLRGLLGLRPDVLDAPGARDLPPIEGELRLENVTFAYDKGVEVLKEIDLEIAAGETVAFVGETGAGKSTIAKLVTRFYDPTEGRVLIDGHDLRDVTQASLRRQLGVVPQEPFLFVGTLRDNVAYGAPEADDERVREAVELVGLDDFVSRVPRGIDAVVHERGQSLSSGERQLLALARAFLVAPRVLVLDEATSNLDGISETRVERALDLLLEGRTAILIAHRLSTARRADRIVVVDDGEIVEVGAHEELLAQGGRYAAMYATWIGDMDHETPSDGSPAPNGRRPDASESADQETRR